MRLSTCGSASANHRPGLRRQGPTAARPGHTWGDGMKRNVTGVTFPPPIPGVMKILVSAGGHHIASRKRNRDGASKTSGETQPEN